MTPSRCGLFFGTALGFAGWFGGFAAFIVVLVLGLVGLAVGLGVGWLSQQGKLDFSALSGRSRRQ